MIALQAVSVGITVCWCFRSFLSTLQLFYVSMALAMTCGSHFAAIAAYNVYCLFFIVRIRCINSMLRQLIIDEPITDEFLFLPSTQQMLLHDFFYMNRYRQREQQDHHQPAPSASLSTHFGSNVQRVQMKWLWLKRTKTTDATIDVATVVAPSSSIRTPSVSKLWSQAFKIFDNHHDTNLNKFVNQLKLTDIKTIFRM